jgi:hypothetical protein
MTKQVIGRREMLKAAAAAGALTALPRAAQTSALTARNDRQFWVDLLGRIADPVLHAASQRKLVASMPLESSRPNAAERRQFMCLEALGRLLAGMAPWIESGESDGPEVALRAHYAELTRSAIDAATDPNSPDFMNFTTGGQPVVDTAFLTLGILRAPIALWQSLPATTQQNVVRALVSTRVIKPPYSNWLLFSALIEAGLAMMGAPWDRMRVDYAVRAIDSFYKGDGIYGDGPDFHWDYYNSFVIQPFLLTLLDAISKYAPDWDSFKPRALARARRYAVIQERLIAPDGSFPAIGRSLAYRCGAFHHLACMALRRQLPERLEPAQVRSALTAVIRRTMYAPGTFDAAGWLNIGLCGHQPEIAEPYISRGSSYLCSAAWLPLGLPATDLFWSAPAAKWTAKTVWSGAEIPADHAMLE